ncbi:hypothetical protein TWF730_009303 [Orbilia blumenaviensis]|uniref:SRR1-like domain-containing protein n=1 Tax=Orbilia blumenaviensis TaxID=1796055 RepID=A0AAV9UZD8_9PEZI
MSARQRHSRVTTDDGWTTISNSNSRKSKNKDGKKKKKKKGDQKQEGEGGVIPNGPLSALLAHKSDLEVRDDNGSTKNGKKEKIDQEELVKVRTRVEKQIVGFESSECCAKVRDMARREFGVIPGEKDGDGDSENMNGIKNVLILALGSLSETFKSAPGYQLAAILSIIEVLKESSSSSSQPLPAENTEQQNGEKEGGEGGGGGQEEGGEEGGEGGKEEGKEEGGKEEVEGKNDINLNIISYDPVYTPLDIHLLSTYNINTIPASSIPTDSSNQEKWDVNWYENAVVYMPHASVWLNHKYFMYKPKVWIGNGFDMYEDRAMSGSEVDGLLKEAANVMKEEGYVKLDWPEADEWGGGGVFNNLVVYVRRSGNR